MPGPALRASEVTVKRAWTSVWQQVGTVRLVHLVCGGARLEMRRGTVVDKLPPSAPGSLLLLAPGWRLLQLDAGSTWRWLHLPGIRALPAPWLPVELPPREHALLSALLAALCARSPRPGPAALALANELATAGLQGQRTDPRLAGLMEEVRADPGRFRSVAALEGRLGLSPAHLRRICLAATGLPPRRWLQQVRMRRARQLLVDWGLDVAATANQLGFSDARSFSRQFRAEFGLPPGRLRTTRS